MYAVKSYTYLSMATHKYPKLHAQHSSCQTKQENHSLSTYAVIFLIYKSVCLGYNWSLCSQRVLELKSCKQQFHDVRIALPQAESLITVEYDQFTRVEAVVEEVLNLHVHQIDVREGEFGLFHPRLRTR